MCFCIISKTVADKVLFGGGVSELLVESLTEAANLRSDLRDIYTYQQSPLMKHETHSSKHSSQYSEQSPSRMPSSPPHYKPSPAHQKHEHIRIAAQEPLHHLHTYGREQLQLDCRLSPQHRQLHQRKQCSVQLRASCLCILSVYLRSKCESRNGRLSMFLGGGWKLISRPRVMGCLVISGWMV